MAEKFNLESLDPLLIRFAIALSILGAIVSFFSALLAGAGIVGVLLQPFIMALIMAAVAAGIYFLLHFMYPEVLDQMRKAFLNAGMSVDSEDGLDDIELGDDMGDIDESTDLGEVSGEYSDDAMLVGANAGSKPAKAKADEILVEGVPIKNEPKLMAEAIQHLLDQDED